MAQTRIADLLRIRNRYYRSAHLERDFEDPSALEGYVVTPQSAEYLRRIASGLSPRSGQRAWRITGDYGVGKSSFALLLTHLLCEGRRALPASLRTSAEMPRLGTNSSRLVPVLVTGDRGPVSVAILRALKHAIERAGVLRNRDELAVRLSKAIDARGANSDNGIVVRLVEEAAQKICSSGRGTGLLLILDELGKFLEFSASRPDTQDVYFLQLLAEAATRSAAAPILVVGLLHQGFGAYAEKLAEPAQREWQKVAGRYEEILFERPVATTAGLVANALNVQVQQLPKRVVEQLRRDMKEAITAGWYGAAREDRNLVELAPRLFPLHPTVLPVLTALFSRFGQNERSLFSFLLSHEPFGLRAFSERTSPTEALFRLSDLYNYTRATFGMQLSAQSYRSHWNVIESVVEDFAASDANESHVLKTVALLNLLDDQGLTATASAIELALSGGVGSSATRAVLERLRKKHVLYARGISGGYCLWPHTSVNLDAAYRQASKIVSTSERVLPRILGELDTRPLVARRHYIQTGNLRHFAVQCVRVEELGSATKALDVTSSDGLILLPLCETGHERELALSIANSAAWNKNPAVLVAVPKPLEMLRAMVVEAQRWEWIATNTPELAQDRYAAEEVSRQIAESRRVLRDRVQQLIGLRSFSADSELDWFRHGRRLRIKSGRDLLEYLSSVCDEVYCSAPRVRNELVNRRELSSAAAQARMRLIDRLFKAASLPLLGMDVDKKPPEMSMYLSVLRRGGMHVNSQQGICSVVEPSPSADPLNLNPTFVRMLETLRRHQDSRIPVSQLFDELRRPPYGVRDGLLPLLLAIFTVAHEHELAFYEDGTFVPRVGGEEFLRLVKEPSSFEVQHYSIAGVRASVFARLTRLFLPSDTTERATSVLDVVRPLFQFVAQLPLYAQRTARLSAEAKKVRAALMASREPATLLFRELPEACGFPSFMPEGEYPDAQIDAFVLALKRSLAEMRTAYPDLLGDLRTHVSVAFEVSETPEAMRRQLSERAKKLLSRANEPRLKGLCLRLHDSSLADPEWLEALAGFLCSKPPRTWLDGDVEFFREEVRRGARHFNRAEAAAFDPHGKADGFALRVALTTQDGFDVEHLIREDTAQGKLVREFEDEIRKMMVRDQKAVLVAASRALWTVLSGQADLVKCRSSSPES